MFVSEILQENEFTVVPQGTGRDKVFNILNPQGQVVGSEKISGTARSKAKEMTRQFKLNNRTPVNIDPNAPDANKGPTNSDDADSEKKKSKARVKIEKGINGIKGFVTKASGGVAGSLVMLFVTYDTFMADLKTYANVVAKTNCNLSDERVNTAQTRFGDRLTSNIMATCLALVGTGLAISAVKKILTVLRAGALFAGPAGWIGYLISWVGAEAAIYGMVKMLEAKWFHAAISDYLMNKAFTKRQLVRLSIGTGIIDEDHPCYAKSAGFIRNEAIDNEDQDIVFETVSKGEIKAGIKDLIVSDPKMLALMKKAKKNKEKGIKAGAA